MSIDAALVLFNYKQLLPEKVSDWLILEQLEWRFNSLTTNVLHHIETSQIS